MGKIGKSFAKKARALYLDIFYYGPNKKKINFKYLIQKLLKLRYFEIARFNVVKLDI